MKTKLKVAIALIISLSTSGFMAKIVSNKGNLPELVESNVLALAEDGLDCSYNRVTSDCVIQITGNVSLPLGMHPDANGMITFKDGSVECSAGGKTACSPKDCADIYNSLLN